MMKLLDFFLILVIAAPASVVSYLYQYFTVGWAVGKDFYFKSDK